MIPLDDTEALTRLDSLGVLGVAESLGEQCRRGWDLGRSVHGSPSAEGLAAIVVLGMGGSGIAGDLVQAVLEPRLPLPMRVHKGYPPLPEWVGRNCLVVAVSYSGDTEETVEGLAEARERGARVITMASGGRVAEAAAAGGLAHVALPGGLQPRSAVGYMAFGLLGVLASLGLVPRADADVDEALERAERVRSRCHRGIPAAHNPAKSLALSLHGRVPVVYGGPGIGAAAAQRFKNDLAEYAKVPAFWGVLPEFQHNDLEAWGHHSAERSPFIGVLLRDPDEPARIAARFEATRRLLAGRLELVTVRAEGRSALARLVSLLAFTQLVAIYLGLRAGRDPGPVDVLQRLKRELAAPEGPQATVEPSRGRQ